MKMPELDGRARKLSFEEVELGFNPGRCHQGSCSLPAAATLKFNRKMHEVRKIRNLNDTQGWFPYNLVQE